MNIREYILNEEIKEKEMRIERLKEVEAPTYFISLEERELEHLKSGEILFSGETYVLEDTFLSIEERVSRGGVHYFKINDDIHYFPPFSNTMENTEEGKYRVVGYGRYLMTI